MERKTFRAPLVLDTEEEGKFKAVFATMNVIDWHEDVTEPGAFHDGQKVIIEPWNHDWKLPVGKGVVRSDDKEAWIDGEFFLDTTPGLDHYRTVKNLDGIAEWSYSFDIEDSGRGQFDGRDVRFLRKLDVAGVGPVTRGAGIDTRTVEIKKKQAGSSGDEGEGDDAKPSNPGADLLTDIAIAEVEMIMMEVTSS